MKNRRAITIKLAMFLVLCVCLISIYCITVPTKNIQYKPYTFHLFGIIYTFIILCSVVIEVKDIMKSIAVILFIGCVFIFMEWLG